MENARNSAPKIPKIKENKLYFKSISQHMRRIKQEEGRFAVNRSQSIKRINVDDSSARDSFLESKSLYILDEQSLNDELASKIDTNKQMPSIKGALSSHQSGFLKASMRS